MSNTISTKASQWSAEDTILVSTIAELKAVVKQAGIVWVKGLSVAGDGGYGSFCYDSTIARSTADNENIVDPTSTGTGSGCWKRNATQASITKSTLLDAKSYATQEPSVVDSPLKLTFGVAQGNASTDLVTIDILGNITFHVGGRYSFDVGLQPGRTTGAGEAIMFAGWLVNGSPVGNTIAFKMNDTAYSSPYRSSFEYDMPAGSVLSMELIRDSAGVNNGGVYSLVPSLAGRPATPATSMVISEFITST